ncbi:lysine exporter LysO family protein [uncultured Alistipes sp.]|uniref:lysine exporter LysO family protein n=1 Tax=uncultured Alistipes sp. TaxID=538949 RepID=UPI00260E429C|nr:lysine exporter LysO family protein [uncultured Alistipes sp.]
MLTVFAILLAGIGTGRLLYGRRLGFLTPLITAVIWLLLFLLGVEAGSDPAVVGGLSTLGATAFVIFALSVSGSILASWALWRWIRRRPGMRIPASDAASPEEERPVPLWEALKGSLTIVAFFVAGCVAGWAFEPDMKSSSVSSWVLYVLMFCVGASLGNDRTLPARVRQLDRRLTLLPVATALGTLLGAALAAPLLGGCRLTDTLAVGAGFGYYSLSSIFIADLRGAELATVALLCNILREIFTLLAAPAVARRFGPLAAVSIGGATTFDTTLPVITQAAGRPYAVVSIYHGCVMDFSVPFLVTFFCSL